MDAVDDIKQRLSIEDVVSEYVELKRAGRNFKGLSPFKSEKTPSFVVSPERQIWHDFSSNHGGDMFTFIQEMEATDFKGALEILARKAGVDLDQYRQKGRPGGPDKERLYALLDLAAKFYQVQFSKSQLALEYVFKKRAFTKETALAWRLGYAPNTGRALVEYAKAQGFTQKELEQAGLVNRYGSDLFKSRLMIPLCDGQGKVIGFTARILVDDPKAPKYMNTPATPLYDKSRHIFGLHHAKETIRKSKFVLLAEGNLDVIASWQAGIRQCVATAGTALTEHQLKALCRFTPDVRLCFDADRAGMDATERALPIASRVGVNLSVVTIPNGKDPDELIRSNPQQWQEIIQKPQYALDWLIDRYRAQLDLTSAQGKREFSDTIMQVVRGVQDTVEQEHYVGVVAKLIESAPEAVRAKLTQQDAAPKRLKQNHAQMPDADKVDIDAQRNEDHFLALLLKRPELREAVDDLEPNFFTRADARAIFEFIVAHRTDADDVTALQKLSPQENYVKILASKYEDNYQNVNQLELGNSVQRLKVSLVKYYVEYQKNQLRKKYPDSNNREYLAHIANLDRLRGKYI